jgi:hypothetical protein
MSDSVHGVDTGESPTKTVVITWVEESYHRAVVRVPRDFEPEERDLANGLAELSGDGFEGLERSGIEVADAAVDDPVAEFFNPPRYAEGTSS